MSPRQRRAASDVSLKVLMVGLMGAGKSVVGRAVAEALGIEYLDNDDLLRAREGLDAVQLAALGPDRLHEAERRQLRDVVARRGPFVAGAAASIADRPDDRLLARRECTVVYLHAVPAVLAERVGRDDLRPWLDEEAGEALAAMYAARDGAFRSTAHHVVESDRPIAVVVDDVLARL